MKVSEEEAFSKQALKIAVEAKLKKEQMYSKSTDQMESSRKQQK